MHVTEKSIYLLDMGDLNDSLIPLCPHIDGLVQERCNSIANALELHLSCTNPLMLSYFMLLTDRSDVDTWLTMNSQQLHGLISNIDNKYELEMDLHKVVIKILLEKLPKLR